MRHGTGVRVRNAEETCLFATQQVVPRLAGMLLPLACEPTQERIWRARSEKPKHIRLSLNKNP